MTSAWDLDSRLRETIAALSGGADDPASPTRESAGLSREAAWEVFQAQLTSRQLDLAAHWLRSWGEGHQEINSAGHEMSAAVAAALRPTDPALLHARSGAFYCARGAQAAVDPVADVLAAVVAANDTSDDAPSVGGSRPPYSSRALTVIPTSRSGGSHLPRALGLAFGIERAKRFQLPNHLDAPPDSVVVCVFGGAEINHASATAALNAAGWCAYAGLPLPVLFLCHDDGAAGEWVSQALGSRPGLRHSAADGGDALETHRVATEAVEWVRRRRRPAVLRLQVASLLDPQAGAEAQAPPDPLLETARSLVDSGWALPEELLARYDEIGWQVRAAAERMVAARKADSAKEVMAPLAPRRPLRVAQAVTAVAEPERRLALVGDPLPEAEGGLTVAQAINRTLRDLMASSPQMLLFGPRNATGGAHGVTEGLRTAFGAARVFDTFSDEISSLGLALGAGLAGLLPVVEMEDTGKLSHAVGQLGLEAAPTQFFSQGSFRNPLVVRTAAFADPESPAGHACPANAVGALRDIPGLVLACPSRPDDAAALLRTCLSAASTDGACSVLLEPRALYHVRDLHCAGDGGWLARYPAPERWGSGHAPIGRARVHGDGGDLTLVSFGNGLRMSMRAARRLQERGVSSRVVDLRWLAPLPLDDVLREANATGRVLVVDEMSRSGGVARAVLGALAESGFKGASGTVVSEDSFVPSGPAASLVLVNEAAIERAVAKMLGESPRTVSVR